MVKRNGKNREHLTALNVPHLGEKINKTCANRPVSCVNGENPSDFGSDKETVYHCAERARTLTEKSRRSDSSALPKNLLIAAWRLSGDGLALSVIACAMPPLPKGEPKGTFSVRSSPFTQETGRFAQVFLIFFRRCGTFRTVKCSLFLPFLFTIQRRFLYAVLS